MKKLTYLYLTGALLCLSSLASASGYQLIEQNASDLGTAYAGSAAIAEDASTEFFNPAGLTRLPTSKQLVVSGVIIDVKAEYNGLATAAPAAPGATPFSQSSIATSSFTGVIPALHYAQRLNDRMVFGFGVTSPYGLTSNYDDTSILRYASIKSNLTTLDVSPSLGYKVNDRLSVGLGIDAQRAQVLNEVNLRTPLVDSLLRNELTSMAYGWHGGIMYQVAANLRLGANYRSIIVHQLKGPSAIVSALPGVSASTYAKLTLALPPLSTVSLHYDVNPQWALMGTVDYTQWSVNKSSILTNAAALPGATIVTPNDYRDTWRYALGTTYKVNPRLSVKLGASIDQTPTVDAHRDVSFPDQNYTVATIGTHYQITRMVGLDASYGHAFVNGSTTINQTSAVKSTIGTSKLSADLVGLQVSWNLG